MPALSGDINNLKEALESNTCNEHRMKPVIVAFNATMIIKCCCDSWASKCRMPAQRLSAASGIKNLIIK
jgi:hypothetical protein